MSDDSSNLGDFSLMELFRTEAEDQVRVLTAGLLALDSNARDLTTIEPLMRAAHSLKGAARIVNLESVERLAHAMEDCFVAAQKEKLQLNEDRINRLLAGVDLISQISALNETHAPAWLEENKLRIANLMVDVYEAGDPAKFNHPPRSSIEKVPAQTPAASHVAPASPAPSAPPALSSLPSSREEQVMKVSARSFDRLLSLASESRVAANAMQPYVQSMQRLKKNHHDLAAALDQLAQALLASGASELVLERLAAVQHRAEPLKQSVAERLAELEGYERRLLSVSQQTLDEVLTLRMRPFRDGTQAFPRMMRDIAKSLGKDVRFEISGEDTLVDRDILSRMESPLSHILRNAIDHGMETPRERMAADKSPTGSIRMEARHSAGMLIIEVVDDGRGVDMETIRHKVIERNMTSPQMAQQLSNAELLDFLFLPAFSLKEQATELSGRGVGLDVVHATIQQLNGNVRIESHAGKGFRTSITLPLSQSVVRTVVVDVAGEAYAVPIAKIDRVLKVPLEEVKLLEGRQFFSLDNENIGLVDATQLLDLESMSLGQESIPVIILSAAQKRFGLAIDAIHGEHTLAVQSLEAIFGKMRNISAAALLDDGSPVLILDTADILVSIDKLSREGGLHRVKGVAPDQASRAKRVLVVDDSLTVREMERKLLQARGFAVDIAVDGLDAWNAVRSSTYELVITDVDMPRMDGIELVTLIKKDSRLNNIPVMIVSYKDRPEDRTRGISAGADYYLTKGSFHDETLLDAVFDLIGEAHS